MTAPGFVVIDAMASVDLPVLLRPARLDVPVTNPAGFNGEPEIQGEFRPLVRLDLPNGKRQSLLRFC